ncbi:MAG: type II secretion system GspH family protein [Planctomycetaceae bacterium]|nr:type II secretion system GspH family protein [Planctomycetaceae bacterium]
MVKQNTRKMHRRGFTLLELLIAISVIAVLAALSVSVMIGIDNQAKEAATVTTLRKLDALLQKRIEGFNRTFDRGGALRDRYLDATRNLLAQDGIFGPLRGNRQNGEEDSAVVETLAKKVAMRHLFPQRHEDLLLLGFNLAGTVSATDFDTTNNIVAVADRVLDANGNRIADAVEAVADDGAKLAATYPPGGDNGGIYIDDATVSSELMYYFLVYGERFGALESVEDQFTTAEVADTDEDGLLEFVDGWGQPLRFYRWPTLMINPLAPDPFEPRLCTLGGTDATDNRFITTDERLLANILIKGLPPEPSTLPNGAVPRDLLLVDPDDPVGVLYRAMEEYPGGPVDLNCDGDTGDIGESDSVAFALEFNATNYHTPDTYHVPLIVSAGADEILGLFEPSDTPNFGNLGAYDTTINFDTMLEQVGDNLTNQNRRAGGRR